MYREKLAQIKQQVSQLHSGTLPEFCRKQKRLDQAHKERQKQVQAYHNYLLSKVCIKGTLFFGWKINKVTNFKQAQWL